MSQVSENVAAIRAANTGIGQRTLARQIVSGESTSVRGKLSSLIGQPFATVYNAIRRFDSRKGTAKVVPPVVEDSDTEDDYPRYSC